MLKIKIESPLVNITFEDDYVMHNGYTMHNIPSGGELLKLIDKLQCACKDIILENVRANKYGCIDLKKWETPENQNEIKVTVEHGAK